MNRPGCLGKGAVDGKVALAILRLGPEPCECLLLNIVTQSGGLTGSSWKRRNRSTPTTWLRRVILRLYTVATYQVRFYYV